MCFLKTADKFFEYFFSPTACIHVPLHFITPPPEKPRNFFGLFLFCVAHHIIRMAPRGVPGTPSGGPGDPLGGPGDLRWGHTRGGGNGIRRLFKVGSRGGGVPPISLGPAEGWRTFFNLSVLSLYTLTPPK